MGTPITISIPHNLGRAEARRRLEAGFSQTKLGGGVLGFQQRWEGDKLHFEASGLFQKATGRIEVADQAVRIELDLPALIASLAEKLMGQIKGVTQKFLENRG